MIRRLRKRFIRITMLSVTLVMVLLSLIVNIANYISTNADLTALLDVICENQGTIPTHNEPAGQPPSSANANNDDSDDTDRDASAGSGTSSNSSTDADADGSGTAAGNSTNRDDDKGGRTEEGTKADPETEVAPADKPELPGKPFNQETPYSTRYFYLRYDQEGNLMFADLDHIAAITEEDTDEYLAVALKHGVGYGTYGCYRFRVIQHGENRYMVVFLDCYQEFHSLKTVALCSLAATLACIALVYFLVVFFSRRAIDPVVQGVERQKQFVTDASHELKTPITVIATSLKVLEMETGKQKWIDKAVLQTERLKDLVNSLVTLARMDEEESPLKFRDFPLSEALTETAESFTDYAQSCSHQLEISIEPDISFRGDEYAIRQLASILLDNGIKYGDPDSPLRISLEKRKKDIILRTENRCENMDGKELDKLFDRFYRVDKSRSKSGFGIGLSIAKSIVEGHGGSIRAESPEEGTIAFTVHFHGR